MKGVSFCPDYPATVFESVCIYNQRKSDVSQRGVLVCWCFQLQPCSATDYLIIRKALATSVELKNQRVWQFSGSRFFFPFLLVLVGDLHYVRNPDNTTPPPQQNKKKSFLLSHNLGVSGWEACQHVSPYSLSLCHRGKSILNKPSESFLCYTFHFPSSKLQGKLACQEDDREQAAEESNREGDEKNDPTPTIKLTNHCS